MTIFILLLVLFAVALIVSLAINYRQKRKLNQTMDLLELQNQNIRLAIRAGNIAVWGFDVKKGCLYNIEGDIFPGTNGISIAEAMEGVHPDDYDKFADIFQNVINGEVLDESICIRFKNFYTGEWEYVEKEFAVIKSRSGEVETVIGTHKDVTKRVLESEKTEALLKQYQHLYNETQAILNSLPTGVSIYNSEGKMFYVNRTMCQMLGVKDYDLLLNAGTTLLKHPLFSENLTRRILKGENLSFGYQIDCNQLPSTYFDPSDQVLHLLCISSVVKNEEGEIESYVFIHRDVTKEEVQEKKMKDMSETLMRVIDASGFSVWEYCIKEDRLYSYQSNLLDEGITYEEMIANHTPESAQLCRTAFHNLLHGMSEVEHVLFEFVDPQSGKIQFHKCELVVRKDALGHIVALYGIDKEVTNEHNYQLELEESRLKTELAVRISDMVQWEYDVDKHCFYTQNERSEKDVLTADDYYAVTHPDDHQKVHEIIQLMDDQRDEDFVFDTRFKFPADLNWQYLKITGTPLKKEKDGKVLKYTGFQRNNTEWQNLTQELKETNDMNKLILNNMTSGLVYLSADLKVIWENASNKFSLDFTGGKPLFEVGKLCHQTYLEISELCTECAMEDVWTKRETLITERTLDNGNVLEIEGNPIFDDQRNLSGIILRIDDISERKRLYNELQKAKNKAEESDTLKSAFLANMSHEIRTPLNSIVGFTELLRYSTDEQERNEFWKIISTNNELLLRLINDILDLAKIEAGAIDLKPISFDLSGRLTDLYSMLKLRNVKEGIEFVYDNPYSRCMVNLDESRITQILMNFVTNAFKFTRKGQIKMGYSCCDGGVRIYCTDTGIGIAADQINRLFTRFSKLNDFEQGSGLGTAICKAIVDAYGGRIGVDSVENEGSTFWAWIPCEVTIA